MEGYSQLSEIVLQNTVQNLSIVITAYGVGKVIEKFGYDFYYFALQTWRDSIIDGNLRAVSDEDDYGADAAIIREVPVINITDEKYKQVNSISKKIGALLPFAGLVISQIF